MSSISDGADSVGAKWKQHKAFNVSMTQVVKSAKRWSETGSAAASATEDLSEQLLSCSLKGDLFTPDFAQTLLEVGTAFRLYASIQKDLVASMSKALSTPLFKHLEHEFTELKNVKSKRDKMEVDYTSAVGKLNAGKRAFGGDMERMMLHGHELERLRGALDSHNENLGLSLDALRTKNIHTFSTFLLQAVQAHQVYFGHGAKVAGQSESACVALQAIACEGRGDRGSGVTKEGMLVKYRLRSKERKVGAHASRERWVSLRDGYLFVHKANGVGVKESSNLLICTVRIPATPTQPRDRKGNPVFLFEIVSPDHKKRLILGTATPLEREGWISALEDAIASSIDQQQFGAGGGGAGSGNGVAAGAMGASGAASVGRSSPGTGRALTKGGPASSPPNADGVGDDDMARTQFLRALEGNAVCADCGEPDPTWCSINLGTLLCVNCSGVHRGLGTHISKVRSVTLDHWEDPLLRFMQCMGNAVANRFWLASGDTESEVAVAASSSSQQMVSSHSAGGHHESVSRRKHREAIVRNKYADRAFVAPLPSGVTKDTLTRELFDLCCEDLPSAQTQASCDGVRVAQVIRGNDSVASEDAVDGVINDDDDDDVDNDDEEGGDDDDDEVADEIDTDDIDDDESDDAQFAMGVRHVGVAPTKAGMGGTSGSGDDDATTATVRPSADAPCADRVQRAMRLLLSGADPNARIGANGDCALHACVQSGNMDVMTALLLNGARPDTANDAGRNVLHETALRDHLGMLRVIRSVLGKSMYAQLCQARDKEGLTPMALAELSPPGTDALTYAQLRSGASLPGSVGGSPMARHSEGVYPRKPYATSVSPPYGGSLGSTTTSGGGGRFRRRRRQGGDLDGGFLAQLRSGGRRNKGSRQRDAEDAQEDAAVRRRLEALGVDNVPSLQEDLIVSPRRKGKRRGRRWLSRTGASGGGVSPPPSLSAESTPTGRVRRGTIGNYSPSMSRSHTGARSPSTYSPAMATASGPTTPVTSSPPTGRQRPLLGGGFSLRRKPRGSDSASDTSSHSTASRKGKWSKRKLRSRRKKDSGTDDDAVDRMHKSSPSLLDKDGDILSGHSDGHSVTSAPASPVCRPLLPQDGSAHVSSARSLETVHSDQEGPGEEEHKLAVDDHVHEERDADTGGDSSSGASDDDDEE